MRHKRRDYRREIFLILPFNTDGWLIFFFWRNTTKEWKINTPCVPLNNLCVLCFAQTRFLLTILRPHLCLKRAQICRMTSNIRIGMDRLISSSISLPKIYYQDLMVEIIDVGLGQHGSSQRFNLRNIHGLKIKHA